jgi:hypothetical protein
MLYDLETNPVLRTQAQPAKLNPDSIGKRAKCSEQVTAFSEATFPAGGVGGTLHEVRLLHASIATTQEFSREGV